MLLLKYGFFLNEDTTILNSKQQIFCSKLFYENNESLNPNRKVDIINNIKKSLNTLFLTTRNNSFEFVNLFLKQYKTSTNSRLQRKHFFFVSSQFLTRVIINEFRLTQKLKNIDVTKTIQLCLFSLVDRFHNLFKNHVLGIKIVISTK
jgi:hypothetical protein